MSYKIIRKDLVGKLETKQAFIQAALDNGWSAYLKSGKTLLEKLTHDEANYLYNSAISYFLSGDKVIQYRTKKYERK